MPNPLLDLGIKAVFGQKSADVQKGINTAGQAVNTFLKPQPAKPKYDVATPEMIQATKVEAPQYAEQLKQTREKEILKQPTQISMPPPPKPVKAEDLLSEDEILDEFIKSKRFQPAPKPFENYKLPGILDYKLPQVSEFKLPESIVDLHQNAIEAFKLGPSGYSSVLDFLGKSRDLKSQAEQQWTKLSADEKIEIVFPAVQKKIDEYMKPENVQLRKEADLYKRQMKGMGVTAEEERKNIGGEELTQTVASGFQGLIGMGTVGLSDVAGVTNKDLYTDEARRKYGAIYEENQELQDSFRIAQMVTGAAGAIGGMVITYGGISRGVQAGFGKMALLPGRIGKMGAVLAENPMLSTYTFKNVSSMFVRNIAEEGIEMGIREGTGQQYGFIDFMGGILAGGLFEYGFSKMGLKGADNALREAELQKGDILTPAEVEATIRPIQVNERETFGDIYNNTFGERRLVYKTGKKGAQPGLTTPAPLPERPRLIPTPSEMIAKADEGLEVGKVADKLKVRVEAETGYPTYKEPPAARELMPGETAATRLVHRGQAAKFEADRPYIKVVESYEGLTTKELEEIGSYIDNPTAHPLKATGKHLAKMQKAAKETQNWIRSATESQTKRGGLLEKIIDPDEYLRMFLISENGKPPTVTQLNNFKKGTSTSMMKRYMGLELGKSTKGLSTKNRYDVTRMFKNADDRDVFLKQFGLKTNRNIAQVTDRMRAQVGGLVERYEMVKSIRQDAQSFTKGVSEAWNPKEFNTLKENLQQNYRDIRDEELFNAYQGKKITEQEYKEAKARTKEIVKQMKSEIRTEANTPADIKKEMLADIDLTHARMRETMFSDLKGDKEFIQKQAEIKLQAVKDDMEKQLTREVDRMGGKIGKFHDIWKQDPIEAYGVETMSVVNALRGITFDEVTGKAIANLFRASGKGLNNLSDIGRIMKMYKLSGDVFMAPEVAKQLYATLGIKGIKLSELKDVYMGGMSEAEYYKKALYATERGVYLGRPSDQIRSAIKALGQQLEDGADESYIAKELDKLGEAVGKIPVAGSAVKKYKQLLEFSNDLQFDNWIPQAKLKVFPKIAEAFQKKYKNLNLEQAEYLAAKFTNDMFQGLNWKAIMTEDTALGRRFTKEFQKGLNIGLLGPDKWLSVSRRFTGMFKKYGAPYRKAFLRQAAVGFSGLQALNYAIAGHSTFENQKGGILSLEIPQITDEKGNPLHLDILGTWAEPFKLIMNGPAAYTRNKLGILPKLGYELGVMGSPKYATTLPEFLQDIAPIPLGVQQLLWPFFNSQKEKTGETGLAEGAVGAALNTVGFGSTYRSGESRTAQIGDVFTGQAGIFEYLTGADIFSKTQIETQKYGMPIKDLPIGERLRAKRLERAAAPKKSAGDRLAEARKKRLAK